MHRRFWGAPAFLHHVKLTHGAEDYWKLRRQWESTPHLFPSAIKTRKAFVTRVTSQSRVRTYQLLALIDEDPARLWTPRDLAVRTDRRWAATRQALSRLFTEGKVLRPAQGIYKSARSLVRTGPFDPRLRFHGLKVFFVSRSGHGGISSEVVQRMTTIWSSPANHRVAHTGAEVFYSDWNGRLITASVYRATGRVEVFLTSTLKPLNLIELHTFFAGVVPTATGLAPELWHVQQMGVSVDLPGSHLASDFSMSFPEGLSVAGFEKGVFRAYEKLALELTRLEAHLYSKDEKSLGVRDALRIMEAAFSSLEDVAGSTDGQPEGR